MLENEANQKEKLEEEIAELRSRLLQLNFEADEVTKGLKYFKLLFEFIYMCYYIFQCSFGYGF